MAMISFEVFPPKTPQGFESLVQVCDDLNQFKPRYFSVTFGAGGAIQLNTQRTVERLVEQKITTTPHISCINMTKDRLNEILEKYLNYGIRHLVVIRGDYPDQTDEADSDFKYANHLVDYIRKTMGDRFHLTVAAYPEFHPQSENTATCLEHFKRKVDAGANSAVTQFFFNSDSYFRFMECCEKLNINIPIIPGIMPIHDYQKLLRFSEVCGAEIPLWLRKRFSTYGDDNESIRKLGIEIVTKLCEQLLAGGAESLHFYTLNQLNPTKIIIENLGLT